MQLTMRLAPHGIRRWQVALAARLRASGHSVTVVLGDGLPQLPGLALLERFEETLYGRHRPLGARLPASEAGITAAPLRSATECILDLESGTLSGSTGRRLVLRVEGQAPDAGLATALLDRRAPWVEIVLVAPNAEPRVIASGLPAVPDANVLIRGFETVAVRIMALVERAVGALSTGVIHPEQAPCAPSEPASPFGAARFAAASLAEKIALRLKRMSQKADQWCVGWREIADDAVIDRLRWPDAPYRWLADDGLRYYADPFVFAHAGERYLFVEDYVYETGRGHLSVARWTGDGWSTPVTCLERPYHLSWPRVFLHADAVWMLPETSETHALELYRAVDFPYVWELAGVLAADLSLADATVVERPDGWWMLASIVDRPGASSWDGLALLRSDDPLRDWRLTGSCAGLIDVRAARPAGDIVERNGQLLRPVQDCSLAYGGALRIARIDALADGRITQTLVAHLPPKPEWHAIGVHTLNTAAGLEVIDINRGFDIARRPARVP